LQLPQLEGIRISDSMLGQISHTLKVQN